MVQLIALAAVGGVAFYAWRELRRHLDEIEDKERRSRELREPRAELEMDPKTGRYRPRD